VLTLPFGPDRVYESQGYDSSQSSNHPGQPVPVSWRPTRGSRLAVTTARPLIFDENRNASRLRSWLILGWASHLVAYPPGLLYVLAPLWKAATAAGLVRPNCWPIELVESK
jgi:hypothetical protein